MTREEYIDMRKAEAWWRAKAALTEVWEWDGQRYGTRLPDDEPMAYEKTKAHIDKFIKETEDEGIID